MRTSRVAALLYRRGCTVWQLGLRWHAWQGGFAEHGTVPWVERQHEAAARHTQHRAAVAAGGVQQQAHVAWRQAGRRVHGNAILQPGVQCRQMQDISMIGRCPRLKLAWQLTCITARSSPLHGAGRGAAASQPVQRQKPSGDRARAVTRD